MIASLGMYDRPETAASNDEFWAGIRENLGFGPQELDRTTVFKDIWQSPDLLFSQTCGMPYRLGLHGQVQLVGTPDYGMPGLAEGYYNSVFVVRADDNDNVAEYRDRRLGYNGPTSQSGWAAAQNHAHELGFQFENLFCSGGHLASAAAVADGRADIAALDGVTWRMICEYDDIAARLKNIGTTAPTPGLPFITSLKQDAARIFQAVQSAVENLGQQHRKILGIRRIVHIDAAQYLAVPTPAAP